MNYHANDCAAVQSIHTKARLKKTFKLSIEGKHPDRVLEASKHEIRKYVKRQRRVPLPDGVDYWDFACKFGASEATASVVHFASLTGLMDAVAKDKGEQFYIEILHKEGHRQAKPDTADPALASPDTAAPPIIQPDA